MNNKITPVSSLNPWPRLEHESIGSFLPLWKSHHTFSIDLLNHWFATKRHVLEQEFIKKKEKKNWELFHGTKLSGPPSGIITSSCREHAVFLCASVGTIIWLMFFPKFRTTSIMQKAAASRVTRAREPQTKMA